MGDATGKIKRNKNEGEFKLHSNQITVKVWLQLANTHKKMHTCTNVGGNVRCRSGES
jgi:hypothetical protein